jgi:hypothetical protein
MNIQFLSLSAEITRHALLKSVGKSTIPENSEDSEESEDSENK